MPEILDFPLLADLDPPESGEALATEFDDRFNALYDAVNGGTGALFQRDTENSIGLLHADFGGHVITNDGGRVAVMAATYALPDSEATVYVEIDAAGTRSHRLDNFTTDGTRKPLAVYATDAASITSFVDARVDFDFMAGGGSAGATTVDQNVHGFALENVLAFDGTNWFKAQADALANCAGTLGIVAEVVGANRFKIQTVAGARLDFLTGKTPGAKYYLSAVTAGALTTIAPSAVGECIVEVLTAESATTGFLSPLLVVEIAALVDLSGLQSNERRIVTMTSDTTATSDDLTVRLLVLRGTPAADSVLTLPNEEFFVFVTNETGVDITVTRATSGVTDSLPPEPDTTATRLYKWIP